MCTLEVKANLLEAGEKKVTLGWKWSDMETIKFLQRFPPASLFSSLIKTLFIKLEWVTSQSCLNHCSSSPQGATD